MLIDVDNWQPTEGIIIPPVILEQIVKETSHSIAILAGPGTGKTEILAQRASFLLETGQCPYPQKILALCFKVDAAVNIKERVHKRCGELVASRFISLTFDSFFISIVRRFPHFLPTWLRNISSDFSVQALDRRWWNNYKTHVLKGAFNPYESDFNNPDKHSPLNLNNIQDERLQKIWTYCKEQNVFDWNMCRSMAYTIIRNSSEVKKLISTTYKYIFLDEFQDTTTPQYEFIKEVFNESNNIITAVGDNNQMIMGWAGADLEVFNKFADDFSANKTTLNINHRSNKNIVDFLNFVAIKIKQDGEEDVSYIHIREATTDISIFLSEFNSKEEEASAIAEYIAEQVHENNSLAPSDFALVLRQMAGNYYNVANDIFLKTGLLLRNEDELIIENGLRIQELMNEPISEFFVNIVRKKERMISSEENKNLINTLAILKNYNLDNERKYKKLIDELNALILLIDDYKNTTTWTNKIVAKIGRVNFKKLKTLKNESDFTIIKMSFDELFQQSFNETQEIQKAIAKYKGEGQVKLMTMHKSKGLEFDTVFFVDFNADAWWGLSKASRGNDSAKLKEEQNTFFVGASRAREKLIFTNGQKDNWPPVITTILNEYEKIQDFI